MAVKCESLVRIPDGVKDETFLRKAEHTLEGAIHVLIYLPDGKILIGGSFNSYQNIKVGNLVRINSDGSMDELFTQSPSR